MEQPAPFVALNRFGLGARPGDLADVAADPRGWVRAQLAHGLAAPIAGIGSTRDRFHTLAAFRKARQEIDRAEAASLAAADGGARQAVVCPPAAAAMTKMPPNLDNFPGRVFQTDRARRIQQMVASPWPMIERLTAFWSNHFAVSAVNEEVSVSAVPYENEAIRPNLFGSFHDLLAATAVHPAMGFYLDANRSIGPDSVAGQRRHASVNENYAREIMELHTLGVNGGYTQADVGELALVLTGLGIDQQEGEAVWFFDRHEPGERMFLGHRLPGGLADGTGQMRAALAILANHPATIRHVTQKLAAHFCGDTPPPGVVRRLGDAWRASAGSLAALYTVLAEAPEAWVTRPVKYRNPQDFVLAAGRALALPGHGEEMLNEMGFLGQMPFKSPAPTGWSDRDSDWLDAAGTVARIATAQRLSLLAGASVDAASVLPQVVFASGTSATLDVVLAEADPHRAMALVLASPEFQRR